jgi:hypothetical protein
MTYQRFELPAQLRAKLRLTATLATVATLPVPKPETVATVATVARPAPAANALAPETVASVAGVAMSAALAAGPLPARFSDLYEPRRIMPARSSGTPAKMALASASKPGGLLSLLVARAMRTCLRSCERVKAPSSLACGKAAQRAWI